MKTIRYETADGRCGTVEGSPEAVLAHLGRVMNQTDVLMVSVDQNNQAPAAARITTWVPVTNGEEPLALPTTLGTSSQPAANKAGTEEPLGLPAMAFARP